MATTPTVVSSVAGLINSPNYGEQVRTGAESVVRKIWDTMTQYGESSADWTIGMEGTSEDSMILAKTDTSKGAGMTMTITTAARPANVGVNGDNGFNDPEQFDRTLLNSYDVVVDFKRFAYSQTRRMPELMGMREELLKNPTRVVMMGEQAGRWKLEDLGMTYILGCNAQNTFFAGQRSTFDDLTLNDTPNINDIVRMGAMLHRQGTAPAEVGEDKMGNSIRKYCFVFPTTALVPLRLEMIDNGMLRDGDVRGDANRLFAGGLVPIQGNLLREREVVDEATHGAVGCEQSPVAYLGKALTTGLTGGDARIYGGFSSALADLSAYTLPMRWFPGYAYTFVSGKGPTGGAAFDPSSLAAGTPQEAPRYVIVENLTGSRKWGMFRISANNGQYLTWDVQLANGTNCGNVTWNADNNTVDFAEGSIVIPVTANGVPYGFGYGLGRKSITRGYGQFRNKFDTQSMDIGHVQANAITSVYGHAIASDFVGRQVGFGVMVHAVSHIGLGCCEGKKPTLA